MFAIETHALSKRYKIYTKPRDRLKELLLLGRRRYHQEFSALKDVTLQLSAGAALGVIGENGSGKSTLLQLLAGTLELTDGTLHVRGRVGALLELGTGFNPEFTGRENALMYGQIMGFSRKEMERRLPAVASFAEIGEFLDRPVKMYSTGMSLRLAFSVATSIDPDILIIDEALAVGDEYFQKKCIDRIQAFRQKGTTIVFCSHNLYQIRMVCDQALWLKEGEVALMGETGKVVAAYENYNREREVQRPRLEPADRSKAFPWISRVGLSLDGDEAPRDLFMTGDDLTLRISYEVPNPPTAVHVGIIIFRNDGVECFGIGTHVAGVEPPPASGSISLRFPRLPLLAGEYDVSVYLLDEHGLHIYDQKEREFRFRVIQPFKALGLCRLEHSWEIDPLWRREGVA